ncbi:MAG TPA: hypothetical protein VFS65_00170 [Candidatus Saccharimonadales bacterium]|nr:hypothetical protein [Candidatus Saccharimonadales bacterium]
MSFKNLLLTIAVALAIVWTLGIIIKVVAWVLDIALVLAAIVFIWWIIQGFIENKKANKRR